MNKIQFAIKAGDKYVTFWWDEKMEKECLGTDELSIHTASDILMDSEDDAEGEVIRIREEYEEYGKVYGLSDKEVEDMKIVKMNVIFSYEIID